MVVGIGGSSGIAESRRFRDTGERRHGWRSTGMVQSSGPAPALEGLRWRDRIVKSR